MQLALMSKIKHLPFVHIAKWSLSNELQWTKSCPCSLSQACYVSHSQEQSTLQNPHTLPTTQSSEKISNITLETHSPIIQIKPKHTPQLLTFKNDSNNQSKSIKKTKKKKKSKPTPLPEVNQTSGGGPKNPKFVKEKKRKDKTSNSNLKSNSMRQNTALGLKAKQNRKMGCEHVWVWNKKLGGSAMLLKWPRNRIECARVLSENERKAKQQQQQHQLRMNEWRFCTNRREMGIGS